MSQSSFFRRAVLGVAIAVLGAGNVMIMAPVFAQNVIEEIVVTARKRAENLQDVPAAVTAYGAEQLKDRGIDNIVEIGRLTPNMTVNETNGLVSGAMQIFIRGIGNDPGFDQGVGIYVDDVYLNRTSGSLLDVYDVERIEILKGPQGNLYGRNTIGGAVKYVSAEPGDERRVHFEAKVGSDDLRKIRAGASGPLAEGSVWGSVAISKMEHTGYQTNRFNGNQYAAPDILSARGTLVLRATDSLRLKLVADLMRDRSDPYIPNRVAINLAPPAGLGAIQGVLSAANFLVPGAAYFAPGQTLDTRLPTDVDEVNSAFIAGGFDEYFVDTNGLSLTAQWDLDDAWSLKSVTAIREMDRAAPFDFDGSDQVFINTLQEWETEDFSQEFQLNYSSENVNAVFGMYLLEGDYNNVSLTTQTPLLRFFTSHVKRTYTDERPLESTSFYANVDWDFSEQWQLSVGGRFTTDKKEINQVADVTLTQHPVATVMVGNPMLDGAPLVLSPLGAQIFPNLPFFVALYHFDADTRPVFGLGNTPVVTTFPENKVGEDEWEEFTPSAKLSYRLSEDTLIYAGVSTGFKSGGFDFTGSVRIAPTYDPEFVTTYAFGVKTTLLEGTMRLNFEAFQNDYEDKQFTVIALIGGSLIQTNDNVGAVVSRGAEMELLWLPPVDGLAVNLNLGILDVEIDELIDVVSPGVLGNVADHHALGLAPELTAQARVQYTTSVGRAGAVSFGLDANYRDEMYTDSPIDLSDPFVSQAVSEAVTFTNAFVSFRSSDNRWRVSLDVKNLSDERVLQNTFQVSNFILGGYTRGRTWGLTLGYDTN